MTTSPAKSDLAVAAIDVIADLAGIRPDSPLAALRAERPEARAHAQGSYAALFDPADAVGLTPVERLAVAAAVAGVHAATAATAHYRQRLRDAGAAHGIVAAADPKSGPRSDGPSDSAVPARLRALLRHAARLSTRPTDAEPDDLQALADAGLSTREIVTLSQIVAFVSFQVRVVAALGLIGGTATDVDAATEVAGAGSDGAASGTSAPIAELAASRGDVRASSSPARIIRPDASLKRPTTFTVEQLAWTPWLEPVELADATPEQLAALESRSGNSPYFRLLAHEVTVLAERTATDRGIFYTPGGAPRAERELAAAATSRLNGCIYCASVHARLAAQLRKRPEDIDRLLSVGVASGPDLALGPRWQGIVDLAVALSKTPSAATPAHVTTLRAVGLSELEILDVAQAAAFFSWANRLMLSLGEPYWPES